jgi:hypothetical protein
MELKTDSVRFDEKQGCVLFEVTADGTEVTVKMPDIYLQDFFSCADPSVEYAACIFDNQEKILDRVSEKLADNRKEKDGSLLISEDA